MFASWGLPTWEKPWEEAWEKGWEPLAGTLVQKFLSKKQLFESVDFINKNQLPRDLLIKSVFWNPWFY